MSGRCRACNAVMSEIDMKKKWPNSDVYVDLCSYCLPIALNPDNPPDSSQSDLLLDFSDEFHIEE